MRSAYRGSDRRLEAQILTTMSPALLWRRNLPPAINLTRNISHHVYFFVLINFRSLLQKDCVIFRLCTPTESTSCSLWNRTSRWVSVNFNNFRNWRPPSWIRSVATRQSDPRNFLRCATTTTNVFCEIVYRGIYSKYSQSILVIVVTLWKKT
jgi:hypothetical protein